MTDPTSRTRAAKQVYNTNPNSWGGVLNTGALDMLDEAFGVVSVAVSGDYTLDVGNYVSDEARRMVLILTGAGGFEVTVPAVDKPYLVFNTCTSNVTITPEGGTGAEVRAGTAVWWSSDGTTARVADPTLDQIKAPTATVNMNNQKITGLLDGSASTEAVNKGQLDTQAASLTSLINGKVPGTITISTETPTGGEDGDLWFRVLP